MTNLLTVFRYELTRGLRRRGYLFTTFGIPLIALVLMLGYDFVQSLQQPAEEDSISALLSELNLQGVRQAGIVDEAGVFPPPNPPLNDFFVPFETVDEALVALNEGIVDVFYVVAPDYFETGDVTLYLPMLALDRVSSRPVEQLFYTTLARDIDPSLLNRLRLPIEFERFNLTIANGTQQNADSDFLMLYLFAITFLLGVFMTNGYLLQSVIEEKENRVIEILITSVRPTELLSGKVLAFSVMGLLQIVTWGVGLGLMFALAQQLEAFRNLAVVSGLRIPVEQLPVMALYFIGGYLWFAAIFGAVGAISTSMREGPSYAAIFTLPAAVPFYFFTLFQATPNGPLPVFLSIFPLTSPISMMMRLSVTAVPAEQVILSLGLLFVSAVGMMWVAGRLFRVQALLAGSVPKLRDIPKLIHS
jgi:ABC-2 type transport system permease protein